MKKIKKILPKIFKLLFFLSLIVGVGIDAYYKFDIPETGLAGNIALGCYLYFCLYLGLMLACQILIIKSWVIKLLIYICLWTIVIKVFNVNGPTNEGLRGSIDAVIVFIAFFAAMLMTFGFGKNVFRKKIKVILVAAIIFFGFSMVNWEEVNNQKVEEKIEESQAPPTSQFMVQTWQLNSRYKINKMVKFLKVDLDKDGKEELAAITSYDKMGEEVFYYAGFYRYNAATEKWDEFYGEELNILNYGIIKEKIEVEDKDMTKKLIDLWSKEFTSLKNIGDVTGDGCPEIVFSSLLQGKDFENYIIVAQASESHPYFKVFWDQRTMAEMVAEDGLLIEKFIDEKYDYKNILEWDKVNLRFKLIESQKKLIKENEEGDSPKINPIWEEFSG